MATLIWSDALALDLPIMDETHQAFVDLLAEAEHAPDAALAAAWQTLVAHTEDHFGREDAWMRATGFSSANCHSQQHRAVLGAMREELAPGLEAARQHALIREMAAALGPWFVQHAQTMDAALALHLRGVGYDAATGQVHAPQLLPEADITGCGSAACSEAPPQDAAG